MSYDALSFSWAGDKYVGTPYSKMDCQAFVEACMADIGYHRDLGGSNSWYRECLAHGWAGTPEECIAKFGIIPKGALIFIWEPVSDSTPEKFRNDGIGDVNHIGIKTGRGDGALHSSYKNRCVCTSKFRDKTIPNGGWNRVGLLSDFDYGKAVNELLQGLSGNSSAGIENSEGDLVNMVVSCPEGETVKLRQSWNESSSLYGVWEKFQPGTKVEVLGTRGEKWKKVKIGNHTGWMMSKYLVADDGAVPAEDPDDFKDDEPASGQEMVYNPESDVILRLSASEASTLIALLGNINEQIVAQLGRG